MASKKKKKKVTAIKKKPAPVKKLKRNCTVCDKPGHNARSHDPGGKLDPYRNE